LNLAHLLLLAELGDTPGRQTHAGEDDDASYELQRLWPVPEENHRHGQCQDRHEVGRHRGDTSANTTHDPVEDDEAGNGTGEGEVQDVQPHRSTPAGDVRIALLQE